MTMALGSNQQLKKKKEEMDMEMLIASYSFSAVLNFHLCVYSLFCVSVITGSRAHHQSGHCGFRFTVVPASSLFRDGI